MLKQPLQTAVSIDNLDFEDCKIEEQLHVGISVKDFKAIVTHAETLKTSITALYTFPTRPLQLSYEDHGMRCEFTLMTIGEYRGGSVTPAPAAIPQAPAASAARMPSRESTVQDAVQTKSDKMPPPAQPASRSFTKKSPNQRIPRPSPPPPQASMDPESLFLPIEEDEDRVWAERNYEEDEDTLGWNASASNVCFYASATGTIYSWSIIGSWPGRSHEELTNVVSIAAISIRRVRRPLPTYSAHTKAVRGNSSSL